MAKLLTCLLCSLFLYTSCGYRSGYDGLPTQYHSMAVPFVEGDQNGELTNAIIKQLSRSGSFHYRNTCADLSLHVKIIDFTDENIGFRYDRHKNGRLRDTIIPTETRLFALVEVTVSENSSCKQVLGPVRLSAHVDFDHDYYSSRNEVNVFSLGQLNDYDAAKDAAYSPLNEALAQKIVDYISDSW